MIVTLSTHTTVAIGFFLIGLGVGELLRRVEHKNIHLPRGLRWLTINKLVMVCMILLAFSSILTGYTTTSCQADYNQDFSRRIRGLSDAQSRVNEAWKVALSPVGGILDPTTSPERRVEVIRELRQAIVDLEDKRDRTPLPERFTC